MSNNKFDFYSPITLKTYNLEPIVRYQLDSLERFDLITRRHSENVGNLCCRICDYLHCTKSFTVHCTICGYLHDIGKMKVPTQILKKPGKLTDEEYTIIKSHTIFGYEICMKIPELRPYALAALDHHEALDGTRLSQWNYQKGYSL